MLKIPARTNNKLSLVCVHRLLQCLIASSFIQSWSINQSVRQSVSQSVSQSIKQSVNQSINHSIDESIVQTFKQEASNDRNDHVFVTYALCICILWYNNQWTSCCPPYLTASAIWRSSSQNVTDLLHEESGRQTSITMPSTILNDNGLYRLPFIKATPPLQRFCLAYLYTFIFIIYCCSRYVEIIYLIVLSGSIQFQQVTTF